MAVKLNKHDLEFILKQIKIAEAHTAGTPLTDMIVQPHLPYGLRTVDGSYNNILPGRELWGAADQTMPRMFDPYWRDEQDGDEMPFGPPGAPVVDNTNYGVDGEQNAPGDMTNGGHSGSVADADPRIISNLIVDQTPANPAAIIAGLRHAGFEGTADELTQAVAAISGPYAVIRTAEIAYHRVESWQNTIQNLTDAIAALDPEAEDYAAQLAQLNGARDGATAALEIAEGQAALFTPELVAAQQGLLDTAAATYGLEFEMDGKTIKLPNVAPDEGLSAPFNGWMTFFGQFFDHGLDLISKGGNGTIYVPLEPDDPLYVPGGHANFMVLTRATQFDGPGPDGVLGTADDTSREQINTTTPFVDQNQTYTSHPSHQVFLREYAMVDGKPLATGHMLDGANGGLPTWADIKAQAKNLLGIELTDRDVFNIPLIRTDLYGEFIRDENGFPQVIVGIGPDGIPNTDDDIVMSGTPDAPLKLNPADGGTEPVRTSHAFLDDIAHNAVPVLDTQGFLRPDGVDLPVDPAGNAVQFDPLTGHNLEYDNELLDRHFITGDGRGNENVGLTAVHHVFHSEHNRQVEAQKLEILKSKDLAFINEWLLTDLASVDDIPAGGAALANYAATLTWDGERLFQSARFATEMQYQHLVFEEFGRKVQPLIDLFIFNTITDIDPAIFSEFANVVYRFGHSMLTEDIGRMFLNDAGEPVTYSRDDEGNLIETVVTDLTAWGDDIGLIEAFLNPIEFDQNGQISHEQAAGAIFRGMTLVHGNEIDEFVVDALRNNLLGLPLDLAAINIARGRDTGMPTLNQARTQLYEASNSTFVKPYANWTDFAANLKTPASIINFIAAYGTHDLILAAEDDVAARRAAATLIVLGGQDAPADRLEFLNGTGAWSGVETGLNLVDLWIGGLAEKKMPFGGMLGSTFNAVFEAQLEMLQDLDRFYYLTRTQGLNLLNELENNAFSKLVMANTDMTLPGPDGVRGTEDDIVNYHVGVDSFAKHDLVLHVDPDKQIGDDPTHEDPALNAVGLTKVQRDDLTTTGPDENYIRFLGGEHVVIGGTEGDDTIISDFGDDALWGGGGNDRIEGGAGVDLIIGGSGDDIITDSGDTGDFIKGEDGDDVIANANGLDVLMGGDGKDVFLVGVDATEVFAGEGDDFVLGGADADFILGNEGDDWIEGGDGFDVLNGDNSELFFNSTIKGHDVLFAGENENDFDAESGDDIMVQGESVMRNEGMFGFDWAIHKGNRVAADSDMRIPIFTNVADDILRDRFDQTEGLSGWKHNDILRGDDRGSTEEIEVELGMVNHELTQAGVDRIDGLRELLGNLVAEIPEGFNGDLESLVAFAGGNILIGGDGHDVIEGRGGDDFIHGDAWLNVRIRLTDIGAANTAENEIATVDSLKHVFTAEDAAHPSWVGKALSELLLAGTIKPSQMHIVREIKYDEDPTGDVDTAVFAGNMSWYEITELDGGIIKVARREMEEVDPQIDEGTDTLVGIERIQFADQIYTVRETGNADPTGRLTISGYPATESNPLTVSADQIRDMNNPNGVVNNITYRWQIERNDGTGDYIDIPNVSGTTFVPDDEHVGLRIRVIGTYIDGGGVIETVTSAATDPVIGVNDEPVGPLLISDMTPTEGQELTATVAFTDPDGMTDAFEELLLTYQWEYSTNGITWTPAEGANSRTFVPGQEHVGAALRVVVTYTDDAANVHVVASAVTTIVGNSVSSNEAVITGDAKPLNVGDNLVQAGDGDNSITGLGGNDVINGGGGSDTLNGGAGMDTLKGGAGADIVNGQAGDDTIIYGSLDGADMIDGGADHDTLRIVESAGGGNDTVQIGLDGAGIITDVNGASVAGIESAQLDLGNGTDTLSYATPNAVTVNLLAGTATGFSYIRNVENVVSGDGNDTLLGNLADNLLDGAGGDDTIRGGFGNDTLIGRAGNDLLYGEAGDDTLRGGDGDDRLDGGQGVDTVSYADASAAVTVTLGSQSPQDTVGAGNDMLVSIENLTGSAFNDTLTGNSGANVIDGGSGQDAMAGGGGDDTYLVDDAGDSVLEDEAGGTDTVRSSLAAYMLAENVENLVLAAGATDGTGNALDNRLTGNSGDNVLDGGAGVDTVVLDGEVSDYDFVYAGANTIVTSPAGGSDTLVNIENVEIGGVVYNMVRGTNAANGIGGPVVGTDAADLVLGFNGADSLLGGGGDDLLVGGAGNDVMAGGAGNDTYLVNNGGDVVSEDPLAIPGSGGIDTIISSVTRNLNNTAQVVGDVENLILTGSGNINGLGNGLDNIISGNSGNNILTGAGGADTLIGNAGDDDLRGGANDDILEGGAGSDLLNGQGGIDIAIFAGSAGDYSFSLGANGLATVTDLVGDGGTDTLTSIERLRFGDGPVLDIASIANGIPDGPAIIFGSEGNDTIIGGPGEDVIIGGPGNDTLNGSDVGDGDDNTTPGTQDDDTFIWNVGDGFDTINGGMEGPNGDVFQIIGNAESETYRIYTYDEAVARIGFAGSDETEIIVTREGEDGVETTIAELTEIEEIIVNGANVAGNGASAGDAFEIYGNFDATNLRPNTITIRGTSGDDTVDISSLQSAHRIVFRSKGGDDTIVGTLRPQDVVELPDGTTLDDYDLVQNVNGTITLSGESHSVTFYSTGGLPQFSSGDDDGAHDDDEDDDAPPSGNDDGDDDDGHGSCDDGDEAGDPAPNPIGASVILGTEQADALTGTADGETIMGLGGRDVVFAGSGDDNVMGGSGADMLYGDAGNDRILAGAGGDLVTGGAGNDTVFGQGGDDMIVAQADDGDDVYYGDGMSGGSGNDTLDMSAIGANITADLGTGFMGRGSVSSAASGSDTIWGVENIVTGSGNDTITGSNAANVMDGGTGNDTFRFLSAAAADGDTIIGFQPGDKIDLSGMDANWCESGNQSFTLVSDAFTGAKGELLVTHETQDGESYTVVQGNISGGSDADFKFSIKGSHDLTASDFNL
ncbi:MULTISPECIES: peroxidase family protein [Chelativorans]|jgi:Ca2+-binding RTX toxin-like protein|uniref:Animal heme peroxidase n=1 Tax=Chelativorans sp. (strain BNC1) TaxID=266779 RepID=Q11K84_CHESB|nr:MULTISPECIES: peroxidase family protein [Chelativorans]